MKAIRAMLCLMCALLLPVSAFAEELTLYCTTYSSTMNQTFQDERPDVTLRTNYDADSWPAFDQVLVDLLSRNFQWDMFNTTYSAGQARTLSDKQYLTDLGQSDIIREAVSRMPESIQRCITNDKGEIFALPHELTVQGRLMGFNTEVAAQLGIEKPRTWAEFLQLIEDWDADYAYAAEDAGLTLTELGHPMAPGRILAAMFDAYLAAHADGHSVSFSTPEFTALMQAYDRHRPTLTRMYDEWADSRSSAGNVTYENDSPWETALIIDSLPLLMDFDSEEKYGNGIEPLVLSITDDPADAIIPVELKVLSLCVGAPHPKLAINYAESLAANQSDAQRILFQGGTDDTPVEEPGYASRVRTYERLIAVTEMAIETDGETPELMEELEQYKLEQADNECRRYLYTGESIRRYAALSSLMRPMPFISFDCFSENANTNYLLSAFAMGTMPVEQFVHEFDRVQVMMAMEAQ